MFILNDKQMAFLDSMLTDEPLPINDNEVQFAYDCGSGNCKSKCGGSCQAACKSSCTSLFF